MHKRKFLLFLSFILFSFKAFPATFVVISNADSGPGTLRDALTQAAANGSTTTDYINFNIADISETGRTINILTQLPDVSSNLVIDGTTQPGIAFGVSDAKVAIFFNQIITQSFSALLVNNQNDVSILGLYIKNLMVIDPTSNYFLKAIEIEGGKNINIGAAGKGNVVTGYQIPLSVNYNNSGISTNTENIEVKDNIFNIDADGITLSGFSENTPVIQNIQGQAYIGGVINEGNIFGIGLVISQYLSGSQSGTLQISNNKIGLDYFGKAGVSKALGLGVLSSSTGGFSLINITDNIIAYQSGFGAIEISNAVQKINILRNYIGTDKTLTKTYAMGVNGIFVYGANVPVAIGNSDPSNANYITNCKPVLVNPNSEVTVNKNSFFCTINEYSMDQFNLSIVPVISILKSSATGVSGTATPNSGVELFYGDKCGTCSPQTYFASTTADNNGNWAYNGAINGIVIASATTDANTSEFSRTTIDSSQVKVVNACTANGTGSIVGAVPLSATNVQWVDQTGKIVGHSADLLGVPPGIYKLIVQNVACSDATSYYEIGVTFNIDDSKIIKTDPSCGIANGSVKGVIVTNNSTSATTYTWKDANGNTLSNVADLTRAQAGTYTLYISDYLKDCIATYGPVTLTNSIGVTIDQSKQIVNKSGCGKATGSITGIQITGGTGNYTYIWWQGLQKVGANKDLTGVPAGTYQLQVTDGGPCPPIFTSDITVPDANPVTMDESGIQPSTAATCGLSNGSITGIKVTGATKYVWTDETGNSYTTPTPDLTKAPAGNYRLTASNGYGCSVMSAEYTITQPAATVFPDYPYTSESTCVNSNTGFIKITLDSKVASLRWVDGTGQPAGTTPEIDNLAAGTYQLYLKDASGCETLYKSYPINTIFPLSITAGSGLVNNDACNNKIGSIQGVKLTGGITPYTYTWTDANGITISTTADLTGAGAGNYSLLVSDASGCGSVTASYTIQSTNEQVPVPGVSNVQVCSSGNILVKVNNPVSGAAYELYDAANSTSYLDENTTGIFKVNVTENRSYYISRVNGTCESSRAEVKVAVGLSSLNITNTFTPNGDGINDYWQISNMENYPSALVQVFTRYGLKVYESRGYSVPFDGTYKGQKLPSGVYYYIIDLSSNCTLLSGSLTIVR